MTREQVLDEAKKCVMQDRNATHGNPEDNFATIAAYWTTYLTANALLRDNGRLDGSDIAAMMVCVKLARLATSPERDDHWVDMAGYAACGCEIATKLLPVFARDEEDIPF